MSNLDAIPPTIEQVACFSTIDQLRRRMVLLQAEVDRHSDDVLNNILVSSADDVLRLRNTYDQTWFQRCLYSPAIKAKIAKRLFDAVHGYSFLIDTSIWTKLVGVSK